MKPALYLTLSILFYTNIFSQLYDSFSDGDFTSNPVWSGDTGDWQIAQNNSAGTNGTGTTNTLRLAAQVSEAGTKYLSSQKTGSWGNEQSWGFWLGRRSSAAAAADNQSIFWLWANESDLTNSTVDGYRIVFGNHGDDNLILEKVVDGISTVILISDSAIASIADISFLVRVTRNTSSTWEIFTSDLPSVSGEGLVSTQIPSSDITNISQGSVIDDTYTNFDNGYLGIMSVYTSSSAARTGAEFDQIYFDTDASSPLPVELLNFNTKLIDNKVLLTWETATEINNYGFEIQRSEFGNQNSEFQTIGFVNGNGNSNSNKYYNFIDDKPLPGDNFYRLKQIDFDGGYEYSKTVGISFMKSQTNFSLEQNYPNPFNPVTKISFHIPNVGDALYASATLGIYNILGELVTTLINQNLSAGKYEIEFDASNLTSGIYYYRLLTNNFTQTRKMLLVK